jgi:hypothetical protein
MCIRSVVISIGVVLAIVASAEEERAPFSIEGLTDREQALFLQGIGQALTVYDLKLRLQGRPRLFCTPGNLSLDASTVWKLANGGLTGPHMIDIVSIAVVDQLQEKFPCDSKSKEEVEIERLKETAQMIEMLKTTVEERTKERYARCLRSVSTAFCDCLKEKLAWQLDFVTYERIAGSTKAQLTYASLSSEDQELVDHVHAIRDECAPLRGSP